MPSMIFAQLAMFVVALVLTAGYVYGLRRGIASLVRAVPILIALYALIQVSIVVFLWQNHMSFPLNLESMELTVLQHVGRAIHGQPIYVEPSPEFVPLAYNPLYYYLAIPFGWILGANLFTLRLVAVLGMLGSGGVIFLTVRRKTNSAWWGLMAAGLFAAAYSAMDAYLDNAHTDSWLLFSVLLGCYLVDLDRSMVSDLAGVLLTVAAFWFKQSGAVFAIGVVLYVTWRRGWRRSWPFWVLALLLGPILYLLAPDWLFGAEFRYYTWEVPRQWTVIDLGIFRRLGSITVRSYALLAPIGLAVAAWSLWRLRSRSSVWYALLPFALVSGLIGALDSESNNNVFILMGSWFIITGVLGLEELTSRFEKARMWGVHLLALLASFAILLYNPVAVTSAPHADVAYEDLVSYLDSLDGLVYAPWIGQLQEGYQFYPAVHWVPMTDLVRGAGVEGLASAEHHPSIRELLQPVLHPEGQAYILMSYPLEEDVALAFLTDQYVLDTDLGERFAALSTLPRRYFLGWPRYLYRYAPPEEGSKGFETRARKTEGKGEHSIRDGSGRVDSGRRDPQIALASHSAKGWGSITPQSGAGQGRPSCQCNAWEFCPDSAEAALHRT